MGDTLFVVVVHCELIILKTLKLMRKSFLIADKLTVVFLRSARQSYPS